MPTNNVKDIIDALAAGKVADANKLFTDEMEDLQAAKLADKRVEIASKMSGNDTTVDLDDDSVEGPELPDPHEIQDGSQVAGEIDADGELVN